MKENISRIETKYIKRRMASIIREAIGKFSVVAVSGARQVGKSTMLLNEFPDFAYFTLDDFDTLDMVKTDPSYIFTKHDFIIIDEAQKLPEIFGSIKLAVDKFKNKRVIISGSSNILLMKNITESLAGRALYFEMQPLTYGEINGVIEPRNFFGLWNGGAEIKEGETPENPSVIPLMLRGFMPHNVTTDDNSDIALWMNGYVKTYLERDLRELSQIDSIIDFRRIMHILALRSGNILNQSDAARDAKISGSTASRYIKLLEISNIINLVPGFYDSKGKRVTKSPKIYFIDPALSIFLSGYLDEESLSHSRELGGYFETTVFFHLKCLCEMLKPSAGIYYRRTTASGKEVDFILEHGRKLLAIEVKMTQNPLVKDAANLFDFIKEYPETVSGILLHNGRETKRLGSRVIAVPWWWIDTE